MTRYAIQRGPSGESIDDIGEPYLMKPKRPAYLTPMLVSTYEEEQKRLRNSPSFFESKWCFILLMSALVLTLWLVSPIVERMARESAPISQKD